MSGGAELNEDKVDNAQRLLNLTLALSLTKNGFLKRDIWKSVPGYREALASGATDDALDKMFDRDKLALRNLGIEIEVREIDSDNQLSAYFIANSTFTWPKDFELNSTQIALLNMAGNVWRDAAYGPEAAAAIDRLRSYGDLIDDSALIGYAPKIGSQDISFKPLSEAIAQRQTVIFNYRNPDGTVKERHLQPWSLKNEGGQWMVTGWDTSVTDEDKTRNFLLKRIVSDLTLRNDLKFTKPEPAVLEAAVTSLQNYVNSNVAEIQVRRGSTAYSHFGLNDQSKSTWVTHKFHFMDRWLLADELREYALNVRVIGPSDLVKTYREGFEKLAALHA